MTAPDRTYPRHYTRTIRTLLRFALIMLVVGLLSGIVFQESAKKYDRMTAAGWLDRWDATMHLALVHGHVILTGVLLPVAMAGVLHLARAHGGAEVSRRALAWTVYTYLPFVTLTIALMLYKGYHVLLAARGGDADLAHIDAAFFGGIKGLRHGLYGLSHVGMAAGLCVFAWCVWRSLKSKDA